jgi:lysyl-tRNA synthetase class 2
MTWFFCRTEPKIPILNALIKKNLRLRAEIIKSVRLFFLEQDYLEVETPVRIPAPAPEAHIDAIESDGIFLQTSPELCMKRLLASGYPRIFQICRCFRKNERGSRHIPEFTMLEWYHADSDYFGMMDDTEALIRHVALKSGSGNEINYQGFRIDLSGPWTRMTVAEAFDKYASVSVKRALSDDIFDETMAEIEPALGKNAPLFLYDYPASCGALAKLKKGDASVVERFELYISGVELCNGFTELTDPVEQRARFENELAFRKNAGKKEYPMPEKFLESLPYMPDSSGNALGIDRLVMVFADTRSIDDVVAFTPEEL